MSESEINGHVKGSPDNHPCCMAQKTGSKMNFDNIIKNVLVLQSGSHTLPSGAEIDVDDVYVNDVDATNPSMVRIAISTYWFVSSDLREAAALFNAIANVMDEKAGNKQQ